MQALLRGPRHSVCHLYARSPCWARAVCSFVARVLRPVECQHCSIRTESMSMAGSMAQSSAARQGACSTSGRPPYCSRAEPQPRRFVLQGINASMDCQATVDLPSAEVFADPHQRSRAILPFLCTSLQAWRNIPHIQVFPTGKRLQPCHVTNEGREMMDEELQKFNEEYLNLGPQYQIPDPELGPLERRVQQTYVDGLLSGEST